MKRSVQSSTARDKSTMQADPPSFAMPKATRDALTENPPPPDPKLKDDENPAKAWSITSPRDFEDMSQEISRLFEGRESEQNWDKRRKAIIKLSRITHGNGPIDHRVQYIAFVKSQLDAILKAVDSLRTNVTTTGLNLLQHIAKTLGQGVDFMVDFVTETLITRCCNTSKVKRDPAIMTFEAIVSNATCNKNVLHYILSASEHKDPNARTAVPSWLTALLSRNGRHCEQAGVLDLIEKCIKNGLYDAKPQVRTPMRSTYGTYAKLWPDRADRLRNSLDAKTQKVLETNSPLEPPKPPSKRPSIRDLKAAKKELDGFEVARPASAQSERSSIKEIKKAKIKEMEARADPSTAPSNRSLARDGRNSKRRDGEAENAVRPSSAQSNRASTRDTKTVRKRDIEGEETVRPPTGQSHGRIKSRDLDLHEPTRPVSGHSQTSSMDRRFHILSSAPMRPHRSFVEVKRVAPRPARTLQQQPDRETPTPPYLEDQRSLRPAERKLHRSKTETLPNYQFDLSRFEPPVVKESRSDISTSETQIGAITPSASPLLDVEAAVKVAIHELPQKTVQQAPNDEETKVENVADTSRKGHSPPKPDRAQGEKLIDIHEDEASAEQDGFSNVHGATRRRSTEGEASARDVAKVSGRRGSATPPHSPTVLREIDQLNRTLEPAKRQDITRQKYISTETAERNRSVSPHSQNPEKARKQLSRAIEKIRGRSMDDYGYRRLQGLLKIHDSLFQDEEKFDELLLALLDTLETPNTEKRVPLGRRFDNKFQILVTIRLMLIHNPKYCVAYQARALCALMTARRNFESRCHIVGGLEETADEIVAACSPDSVLDPVLDVLELQEEDDDAGSRAVLLGFHVLQGLAARMAGSEIQDKVQEKRLTRFASRCLHHEDSEIRRAAISFCVELRRLIEPEEKYFELVAAKDESLKALLTYFITNVQRK